MKYLIALTLLSLMSLNSSCNDEKVNPETTKTTTTIAEEKGMNIMNLLGTWRNSEDNNQQFSLYNDGTVEQQNMSTLELKDWTLEGDKLVFARRNSTGEMTQINQVVYDIVDLTDNKLIVSNDGNSQSFIKVK